MVYHKTVYHMYGFVNKTNVVHIQHIESFHTALKSEIRIQKGFKPELSPKFSIKCLEL